VIGAGILITYGRPGFSLEFSSRGISSLVVPAHAGGPETAQH
jgi:hypothetical protein